MAPSMAPPVPGCRCTSSPLVFGERPLLAQDLLGDGELAEVVERGHPGERAQVGAVQPQDLLRPARRPCPPGPSAAPCCGRRPTRPAASGGKQFQVGGDGAVHGLSRTIDTPGSAVVGPEVTWGRARPLTRGASGPSGSARESAPEPATPVATSANVAASSSVRSAPRRRHGSDASSSVTSSTWPANARPGAREGTVGPHPPPPGELLGGDVPLVVAPPPAGLDHRPRHGAGGDERHVRLAAVEPGAAQGGQVAVAPVLAQHGGGVPQRQTGVGGPGLGGIGGRQRRPAKARPSTATRASATARRTCPPSQSKAKAPCVGQAAQRGVDTGQPGFEHTPGRCEAPGVGQGARRHPRCEIEERGAHHRRPHRPQGRGAPGEVAHPEPAQPGGAIGVGGLGGEVGHGVQRLEQPPHSARRAGCVHRTMVPARARRRRSPLDAGRRGGRTRWRAPRLSLRWRRAARQRRRQTGGMAWSSFGVRSWW